MDCFLENGTRCWQLFLLLQEESGPIFGLETKKAALLQLIRWSLLLRRSRILQKYAPTAALPLKMEWFSAPSAEQKYKNKIGLGRKYIQ